MVFGSIALVALIIVSLVIAITGDLVVGLSGTLLGALLVVGAVWWLRRQPVGAWLDGTALISHTLGQSATCDLATAHVEVSAESPQPSQRGPLLIVRDATTAAELWIPMRGPYGPMPSDQLRALADALAVGPRQPQDGDPVGRIVERLRQLADDPFYGML